MDVDLETQELRRHVRAVGLINGALYRPRRWRSWFRKGRHRDPGDRWLLRARISTGAAFTQDSWSRAWFIATTASGLLFTALGLVLLVGTNWWYPGFVVATIGAVLLVTAVLIVRVIFMTASPDERPIVDPHGSSPVNGPVQQD